MNYSNPDYGGIGQQDTYGNMPPQEDPYNERRPFSLTPEEKRVLKECSQEGIYKRGIPMGITFGLIGLFGAKAGPLMTSRFGAKPAVLGLGALGYLVGRFSYSGTCMQRVLNVPDGNLRKIMMESNRDYMEQQDRSNFYQPIDTPKDQQDPMWDTKRRNNSDIDLPTTSSFDTVPSDYYTVVDQPAEEIKPQTYTSYDDLRRKNRLEYSDKMYQPEQSQKFRHTDSYRTIMKSKVPDPPPIAINEGRTKYGDSWD